MYNNCCSYSCKIQPHQNLRLSQPSHRRVQWLICVFCHLTSLLLPQCQIGVCCCLLIVTAAWVVVLKTLASGRQLPRTAPYMDGNPKGAIWKYWPVVKLKLRRNSISAYLLTVADFRKFVWLAVHLVVQTGSWEHLDRVFVYATITGMLDSDGLGLTG